MSIIETCKRKYYAVAAWALVTSASVSDALAQATSTTDPANPIQFLKDSRSKAGQSNLDATSFSSGATNVSSIIAMGMVVVGLALASVSGYKLYKANQDENSRENTGASVAGLVIGSLLTIIGVIVGVVVNYAIGKNS